MLEFSQKLRCARDSTLRRMGQYVANVVAASHTHRRPTKGGEIYDIVRLLPEDHAVRQALRVTSISTDENERDFSYSKLRNHIAPNETTCNSSTRTLLQQSPLLDVLDSRPLGQAEMVYSVSRSISRDVEADKNETIGVVTASEYSIKPTRKQLKKDERWSMRANFLVAFQQHPSQI